MSDFTPTPAPSRLASVSQLNTLFDLPDELEKEITSRQVVFIPLSQRAQLNPTLLGAMTRQGPMIYPSGLLAADELLEALIQRRKTPVLVSGPGQGKSQTITNLIMGFLQWQDNGGLLLSTRPSVIWMTMINDNDLRDQGMLDYLKPAQLDQYVLPLHVGNLTPSNTAYRQLVQNILDITNFDTVTRTTRDRARQSYRVLLIDDESHLGLGRRGNLDRFCQTIGIDLKRPPSDWDNPAVYVVKVSATPFPQHLSPVTFQFIRLQQDASYLSLAQLRASGRLRDNAGMDYAANDYAILRAATREVVQEWANTYMDVHADGTPAWKDGWTLRVATRQEAERYAAVIRDEVHALAHSPFASPLVAAVPPLVWMTMFYHRADLHRVSSSGLVERPIADFVPTMARPARQKGLNILFIIKAAQAGKTLRAPHLIRWDDLTGTQTDTVVQSAGRACGYGKDHEHYTIWCNLKEVDKYINWYASLDAPTGVPSTVSSTHTTTPLSVRVSRVELHHTDTLAEMEGLRAAYEYPLLGLDQHHRSLRNIHQLGRTLRTSFASLTALEKLQLKQRFERWFDEILGRGAGRLYRSDQTMRQDSSVYVFPVNWDGHLHVGLVDCFPTVVHTYLPSLHQLYAQHGPGYYWYRPVEFADLRTHKPTSLLH